MDITKAEVAEHLEQLADDPDYALRASDLRSLASAVSDADDDSWTGVDLFAAFPASSTVSVWRSGSFERYLGILSGISVFLPVAWTWWSLHAATSAYHSLLGANGEKGRTFLALWTEGFDGRLASDHRLVPMAKVSVWLIVVAVALIVLHRLFAQAGLRREDEQSAHAEAALVSALSGAQRVLNERRSDDPARIESLVKRSVKELHRAHERTREGSDQLHLASERLRDAASNAGQASGNLAALVAGAQSAQTDLTATLASVHKQLDVSLAELRAGLSASTQDLQTATTKAVSALAAEVGQVADTHRALKTEVTAIGANHASVGQVIGQLDDSLERHESALQGQVSELTAARDAAERMLSQLERIISPSPQNGVRV
ncbi:hypothetical protein SAMN05421678_11818 [Actinopolymorpha cephalotaxi]|uniref:Nucleic acid-binding Zn-ribbon protein n=1 Tax=Actinopolymorpha cephalotaxi TaxID=504797 RepID=A0A1I3A3L9_9ACTN|nr:hypothetical protein [Actinopolymorpha cephalotaxi]NYH85370.1 putative nucleic acid-binding Zn-ribbon protein [Actinopolymorpha cephalotaxi]SFH44495.1 hypothetical protein SAMN05421678_11818 [Actinopolymorpha cephalotaxi]